VLIEIYADVVCPWCYIGENRLEKALAQRPELAIERRWQPFQLRPEMPKAGVAWPEFARDKFGGWENAQAAFAMVTQTGAAEGLSFDFERVASAPNTVDAHRLILWAEEQGKQSQMANALFSAYFAQGRDLNNSADLVEVAVSVGLEAGEVQAFLDSPAKTAEVATSQQTASRQRIQSVPTYIIEGRYKLVGAAAVSDFLRAFDLVLNETALKA